MSFLEIEVKLKSNLTNFCLEVAKIDHHCFREGTELQPGIFPSLWALWDTNNNQRIEMSELASARK